MKSLRTLLLMGLVVTPLFAQQQFLSQSITGERWEGGVKVIRETKKVTIHPTYLEIEEEVELAATATWRGEPGTSVANALEIYGDFVLPHSSVVTGAVLWENGQMLRATLKSAPVADAQYDSLVDHDWTWVPRPGDPLLIGLKSRNDGGDIYEFKLFPVAWGGIRQLRIRYLVPMLYVNSVPTMKIPSVFVSAVDGFSNGGSRPNYYTLEMKSGAGVDEVRLTEGDVVMSRRLSATPLVLIQNYNDNSMRVELPSIDSIGLVVSTTIDTGKLAGEYLHYYSAVPAALREKAETKREVVFLWRWDNEKSLVENRNEWGYLYKQLSNMGEKLYEQGLQIQHAVSDLLSHNAGVGMVLDREGSVRDTTLPIGYAGSSQAEGVRVFMDNLLSNRCATLLEEIDGHNATNLKKTALTSKQVDSLAKAGVQDFVIAIDEVKTLFSPEKNVIKHIVVLTVGSPRAENTVIKLDSLLNFEGITMSTYGKDAANSQGYWPGVDLGSIAQEHGLVDATIIAGYSYPKQDTVSYTLYLKSSKKVQGYSVLNQGDKPTKQVYFTGHAQDWQADSILWVAQDARGNELATYVQNPLKITSVNDTDIVMLWGGSSSSPYSEIFRAGSIGKLVGFVDEQYSLLALPTDTVSQAMQDSVEAGGDIANLTSDEIFVTPVAPTALVAPVGLNRVMSQAGGVRFSYNVGTSKSASLKIYDIKGRLIFEFTREQLIGKSEVLWSGLSASGASVGKGMYVARFTMDGMTTTIKFVR